MRKVIMTVPLLDHQLSQGPSPMPNVINSASQTSSTTTSTNALPTLRPSTRNTSRASSGSSSRSRRSHPPTVWTFAATLLMPEQVPETAIEDAWAVALKRRGVYNLFAVPLRLERLLVLGQCICLDEFLTIFTYLPLRVLFALIRTFGNVVLALFALMTGARQGSRSETSAGSNVAAVVDILHASLLVITAVVLQWIDVSWVYHNIRGQSVIKLYVVFNVIEIFDRLCSSFGVDILDSLGWTTASAVAFFSRERSDAFGAPGRDIMRARALQGLALVTRMTFDYIFTLVYVVIHSTLLLTWLVTLNVAINTQNNALLTLLVSNNFVELKGSVFKSFKVQNLFQIACADAVERFQMNIFLAMMLVVATGDQRLFKTWGVVYACEVIVDWIKHAFVTKFNRIPYRIYYQFSLVICDDMVNARKHSVVRSIGGSAVSKRIGFVSLPLAALVIRMVLPSTVALPRSALGMIFMILLLLKTALSIALLGHAHRKMKSVSSSMSSPEGEDEDRDQDIYWHQKLINVERYDLVSKT